MIHDSDVYKIGSLGKPHGVKGEITFNFTDDVWDRTDSQYLICRIDGILVPFMLDEYRFRGEFSALLKFSGIETVEEVREFTGCEVFFEHSLTPAEREEEEYTWRYFTGFKVVDHLAGELGEVDAVDDSTQNVLFRVGELLIPAVEEFIQDIDHRQRILKVALPEGLLEL